MLGVLLGITVAGASYVAPTLPQYIREMDVIKQWGISKATLIRRRKEGLPFVRIGAYICYKPDDLVAEFCQPRSWKANTAEGKEGNNND